ncbi:ATP-binding protein [Tepidibacillus fermentans]|uniref:histidine kinase n=1 Tax=Tepidibacillus fermentans TaxID=1281767 RepID=A0A4R3KH09_9BACI|nr:ATP-binding protein [Tepidibacillus fermentans]TCS82475.1 two-component system sensor histidine kinase BaeS [Tepidibacillus fermentans]
MKLQTKLIIAFSSIVVIMALLQSIFFQNRIQNVFENYVRQNESERIETWKEILTEYYQFYGKWDDIQQVLVNNKNLVQNRKGPMWKNNQTIPRMAELQLIVADKNGKVIGDSDEEWIGHNSKEISGIHEDLLLNGQKIGELIIERDKSIGILSLEQQFLNSMNNSLLFGTAIAVVVAVLFGIVFANKLTKPLESLMIGIRHLAKGDTSYRVTVNTKDEFHQLSKAFNEMSAKLEHNEEVRKQLVADVAHELRTPLSILRGQLESIQEGAIQPTPEVILQLNDEVLRLTRLVNDLQQLSLAEAGQLVLNKKRVNIKQMIQKIMFHFEWLAEEKEIQLQLIGDEEIMIEVDPDRFTQVIVNLLGNALRHTPNHGKVTIEIKKEEQPQRVMISLKDSGPGIDEEYLPYIFERFYRTDSSRSRDQGGTGLGLSIAKGFVEAHGGRINVESKKGEGTTFLIQLPL